MSSTITFSTLSFHVPTRRQINLQNVVLEVIPKTLKINFELSWKDYDYLYMKEFMNFSKDIRSEMTSPFIQNNPVQITAIFNPDHFPITDSNEDLQTIIEGLAPQHIFFTADNWMPTNVTQGDTGYRTIYDFLNIEALAEADKPERLISEAMLAFMKESLNNTLSGEHQQDVENFQEQIAEKSASNIEQNIDSSMVFDFLKNAMVSEMKNIPDNFDLSNTDEVIKEIFTQALEEEMDQLDEDTERIPLYEIVLDFLKEENWPYTPLEDSNDIYIKFTGHNGQWHCFVRVLEEEERFIFYSVLPNDVSKDKIPAFAELITRINFNTLIGNFELDFDEGTVRYKTSIDVQNDGLSVALVRNHVYVNLYTMDQYIKTFEELMGEKEIETGINFEQEEMAMG